MAPLPPCAKTTMQETPTVGMPKADAIMALTAMQTSMTMRMFIVKTTHDGGAKVASTSGAAFSSASGAGAAGTCVASGSSPTAGGAARTQREGRGRQSRSDDERRGAGRGGRRRQRGATGAEAHRRNDRSERSQVVGWAARSEDERITSGGRATAAATCSRGRGMNEYECEKTDAHIYILEAS